MKTEGLKPGFEFRGYDAIIGGQDEMKKNLGGKEKNFPFRDQTTTRWNPQKNPTVPEAFWEIYIKKPLGKGKAGSKVFPI